MNNKTTAELIARIRHSASYTRGTIITLEGFPNNPPHHQLYLSDLKESLEFQEATANCLTDYEEVMADHKRLVRELDVALNGEEGAAKQASLCDILAQVKHSRISVTRLAELEALLSRCDKELSWRLKEEGHEPGVGIDNGDLISLLNDLHNLRADTWSPIETAPKDGTSVLLQWPSTFHEKPNVGQGAWREWLPGHSKDKCWKTAWDAPLINEYAPTHWMPLPQALQPKGD